MAATVLQQSVILGTKLATPVIKSAAGKNKRPPLAQVQSVGDLSRKAKDPLPGSHGTSAQDITLLGSSSRTAFDSFWDNVLSETKTEGTEEVVSKKLKQKTLASGSGRSAIGREDWRAVRRVVDFDSRKAKELRRKLRETESFHDTFYHSHVAEMLANRID